MRVVSVRKVFKREKEENTQDENDDAARRRVLHSCSMLYAVAAAAAEGNQGREGPNPRAVSSRIFRAL